MPNYPQTLQDLSPQEKAPLWTDRQLGWSKNSRHAPSKRSGVLAPGAAAVVILRLLQGHGRSQLCALTLVRSSRFAEGTWASCGRPTLC